MPAMDFRFKDYFSRQSSVYAQARPSYPDGLFSFLSSLAPAQDLVWDCATGNGQAAKSLARYFDHVIATDASAAQIAQARQVPNVEYRVAPAEESGLEKQSVSLITVATALHWFELEEFYTEVRRVLKPGGVIAAWSYSGNHVNPEIDRLLKRLWHEILLDYWPSRSQVVWDQYKTISFPFEELEHPVFTINEKWDLGQQINYMMSWSGSQRYMAQKGENPVKLIEQDLREAWGDPAEKRHVTWEIFMRIGKII